MQNLKAILFDLDGTICTSMDAHFDAFKTFFHGHQIALTDEAFNEKIVGNSNDKIFGDFFPDLPTKKIEAFAEQKEALFRSLAHGKVQFINGLETFFPQIRKIPNIKIAVVTNAPRKNAEFMLKSLEIYNDIDLLVIAEELPRTKPDPLPYQHALKELGIDKKNALCFEDTFFGVTSAVNAGVTTIGISESEDISKRLIDAGAITTIAKYDYEEISKTIRKVKIIS